MCYPETKEEYRLQLKNVIRLYLQDPDRAAKMYPYFSKEMAMVNDGETSNPYLGKDGGRTAEYYVNALIWRDVKKFKKHATRQIFRGATWPLPSSVLPKLEAVISKGRLSPEQSANLAEEKLSTPGKVFFDLSRFTRY
jgi:hypothetical protein